MILQLRKYRLSIYTFSVMYICFFLMLPFFHHHHVDVNFSEEKKIISHLHFGEGSNHDSHEEPDDHSLQGKSNDHFVRLKPSLNIASTRPLELEHINNFHTTFFYFADLASTKPIWIKLAEPVLELHRVKSILSAANVSPPSTFC